MQPQHGSSECDEATLAVLLACHHRGPLSVGDLSHFLPATTEPFLLQLCERGLMERRGALFGASQRGRDFLDRVLEGVEAELTPDAPEYMRRYRRAEPSLPFEANTTWAEAVCVNMRVRPEALRPLVPPVFDLDTHDGWGFVSLTASRLKDFGVGWAPSAFRMNFYQATYRAHVSYTDFRGQKSRGCYFTRSETNSHLMSLTANLLPEFRAHHCQTYPIVMVRNGDHWMLTVDSGADPAGKVVLVLDTSRPLGRMPARSCFPSVKAAFDLIVDFYDAFSFDPQTREVLLLQIDRGPWNIEVFEPVDHYLGYVSAGPFPPGSAELDSVFYFRDCPYRWLPLLKEKVRDERFSG